MEGNDNQAWWSHLDSMSKLLISTANICLVDTSKSNLLLDTHNDEATYSLNLPKKTPPITILT